MIRNSRLLVTILLSLLAPLSAEIEWQGKFTHDSSLIRKGDSWSYSGLLLSRVNMTHQSETWRFYSDFGIAQYLGEAGKIVPSPLVDIKSVYVRWTSPPVQFSVGRHYINLGLLSLFNPFELDSSLVFNDLAGEKKGLDGCSLDFSPLSHVKFRTFLVPNSDSAAIACGLDSRFYFPNLTLGMVYLRERMDGNSAGLYSQFDLLLNWKTSIAFHFDDDANEYYPDFSAGVDYSFFNRTVLFQCHYKFEEKQDSNPAYQMQGVNGAFLKGEQYLYVQLMLSPDEFFNAQLDCFYNLEDGSLLFIPTVANLLANGLKLAFYCPWTIGDESAEFSEKNFGLFTLNLRLEAKI